MSEERGAACTPICILGCAMDTVSPVLDVASTATGVVLP